MPDLASRCNEFSAQLIHDHPQRFGALAILPLPDVDAALRELEYTLDTLKLDGVVLLSSVEAGILEIRYLMNCLLNLIDAKLLSSYILPFRQSITN